MSKCRTEIQCSQFFVNIWRQCAAPWIHRHQKATPFGTFGRPSRLLVRQTQKLVLWSLSSTWTCLCLFWFFLGVWRPRVWSMDIHPASRGVAAHTAGLFRSVRGAKGGFPPWGLPKLRIFTSPPVGAPQAREFSLFPPVGAPQAREFSLFPPVGAPQAREFSLFPPVGAPQAREFSLFPPVGAPQAREFSLFPPVGASQAREFSLFPAVTLPWRLSKLRNFK